MKQRTFLAIVIPDDVRMALQQVIADLQALSTGVQWIAPEKMHVTLRFFGDVDEGIVSGALCEAIRGVMSPAPLVTLDCVGIGVFPQWRHPRVIWAGLSGNVEPVIALHDQLNASIADLPIAKDERDFRLHLTVGRVKKLKNDEREALVRRIEQLGPVAFGAVPIKELVLYKSQLTKQGAVYTPLQSFPFNLSADTH